MFILKPGEKISGSCGTTNAINLSVIGQGNISFVSETPVNNLVQPLTTSVVDIFVASEQTIITHFILTNVTGSTVNSINVYLNGAKIVSNITIKANTTVTLHSGGFTQYPPESGSTIYTGSGGEWGTFTGDITSQTDLMNTFVQKGLSLTAGETISSGMAVVIWTDNKVYKYDITNSAHAGLTCGIAKTSGTLDNFMDIVLPGNIITESGSGWISGISYFVAATSLLTSTAPTSGIIKKIGTGIDVDTILVNNYNELIII